MRYINLTILLTAIFISNPAVARSYKLRSQMPAKPAQKMGLVKIKQSKTTQYFDKAVNKVGPSVITNMIGGPVGFAMGAANKYNSMSDKPESKRLNSQEK